jgi:hypothetical protein
MRWSSRKRIFLVKPPNILPHSLDYKAFIAELQRQLIDFYHTADALQHYAFRGHQCASMDDWLVFETEDYHRLHGRPSMACASCTQAARHAPPDSVPLQNEVLP